MKYLILSLLTLVASACGTAPVPINCGETTYIHQNLINHFVPSQTTRDDVLNKLGPVSETSVISGQTQYCYYLTDSSGNYCTTFEVSVSNADNLYHGTNSNYGGKTCN